MNENTTPKGGETMLNDPRPIRDNNTIGGEEIETLESHFPDPPQFSTDADIEALDNDGALNVLRCTRRVLVSSLLHQESHEHMTDDCGDYLTAALDGFAWLFDAYESAPSNEDFVSSVKAYLRFDEARYPEGACDGDARYAMLSQALLDSIHALRDGS